MRSPASRSKREGPLRSERSRSSQLLERLLSAPKPPDESEGRGWTAGPTQMGR